MTLITGALCAILFLPLDFKDFGASAAAYAAMAANVLFWKWNDYFAGQHASWPLLHTWSLAVEEQFYLVFPFLLWGAKKIPAGTRVALIGIVAATSLAISVYQSYADPRSAYYLLPSRTWELLLGSLVSYAPRFLTSNASQTALGLFAISGITIPMFTYTEQTRSPGAAAIVPTTCTMLLIYVLNTGNRFWIKAFSARPLVWFGVISYSLYLWHWPLLTISRYPWSAAPETYPWFLPPVMATLAVGIAWLSYQFIERPLRRIVVPDIQALRAAALSSLLLMLAGGTIYLAGGLPNRLPLKAVQHASAASDSHPYANDTFNRPISFMRNGPLAIIGDSKSPCRPVFALWGDSHADALVPAFDLEAKQFHVSGYAITRASTPPLDGLDIRCYGADGHTYSSDNEFRRAALERLAAEAVPIVVLAGRWSAILAGDFSMRGVRPHNQAEKENMLAEALIATKDTLVRHGTKQVWIVTEVPTQPFHVPKYLAFRHLFGSRNTLPINEAEFAQKTEPTRQIFSRAREAGLGICDISHHFFIDGNGCVLQDDVPMYKDHTHLSSKGAEVVSVSLKPIFIEIAARCEPQQPAPHNRE
jgi:peptidoglycan/LPS O-acetylase OafA/YrhL